MISEKHNQEIVMEPNQAESSTAPTPMPEQPPVQPTAPAEPLKQPKASKLPLILSLLIIVILIVVCGGLGYAYKTTSDRLNSEVSHYKTVLGIAQAELTQRQAADEFIAKYNDASLSRQSCGGKSLLMSDVHVGEKYVVYRYLCADQAGPILIGAFAKHPNGVTDFTYGSSAAAPNKLPSYIYDTEPEFYGAVYGTTRF